MRYDGLTDSEVKIITTPLSELTNEERLIALDVKDKLAEIVWERNKFYVSDFSSKKLHIIGDDLGTQGILNHANGKMYDSKSKYYADLKASGHVIHESGMVKKREVQGDFDSRKDVAAALNKLGY